MSKKIALEIFQEIKKRNERVDNDSIPHSDDFVHHLNMAIGIEPAFARQLIKSLIEAHMIFAIEIVGEDRLSNIPKVEGYVECDLKTLRKLKLFFQDELIRLYESEHYKRVTYHQVVKEIMPIMNTLNNTPLGQVANKAIMMGELERMMEKNFEEYTEEWKSHHLNIEINKAASNSNEKKVINKTQTDNKIVIQENGNLNFDNGTGLKKYSSLISKNSNYPLARILKIYGIEFFFKAQIRRKQFAYLSQLVETGKFLHSKDLLSLREMIFDVKKKISKDPKLQELREDVFGLERAITHRLYFNKNLDAY
ncbi:MAG: hypothetical protein JW864_15495 [Spirochaetes bacterium]|nr:hypothetical protein [Spirochaetota bacterium]